MTLPSFLQRPFTFQAERFIRGIHRRTHQLPVALRSVQKERVLMIAPHMDDEVIAAGGTLALHQDVKSDVKVVFTSDSEGDIPPREKGEINPRWIEAQNACASLGIQDLSCLGYPDGNLILHVRKMAKDLASLINEFSPTVIFCPFPADCHQDHQASSVALARALDLVSVSPEIWTYEIWSTLWPNVGVDISSVVARKRQAIGFYPSQLLHRDYSASALGLNSYRGMRLDVDYAESFYVAAPRAFQRLCKSAEAFLS